MSQLFASGGQSIGASASASVLPMKIQDWFQKIQDFRIDWFDLPAVQETLKSLLQHHSSKASIIWYSAIFMVQLSHPYMTTGKTVSWTIQTFAWKNAISYRKIKWLHLHFRKTTLAAGCWSDSIQFSCSVVTNSLWHHGLQQSRLPCPSSTPWACWKSTPSSR